MLVFMWLHNINEEPDCIKTMDFYSSIVATVIKTFKEQKFKCIAVLQNILYFSKLCDFLKSGYLCSDCVCAIRNGHFDMK